MQPSEVEAMLVSFTTSKSKYASNYTNCSAMVESFYQFIKVVYVTFQIMTTASIVQLKLINISFIITCFNRFFNNLNCVKYETGEFDSIAILDVLY